MLSLASRRVKMAAGRIPGMGADDWDLLKRVWAHRKPCEERPALWLDPQSVEEKREAIEGCNLCSSCTGSASCAMAQGASSAAHSSSRRMNFSTAGVIMVVRACR